jgi:hypothetical protein
VSDPEEAIRQLASTLIDEVAMGAPPFNPEILVSYRGVVAVRCLPMKEAARLIPSPAGFEIDVNADHTPGKQNFSIGHEVSHTFSAEFGAEEVKVDRETGAFNAKQEEEYLCDVGASTLLFDPRWFLPMASGLGVSPSAIL